MGDVKVIEKLCVCFVKKCGKVKDFDFGLGFEEIFKCCKVEIGFELLRKFEQFVWVLFEMFEEV